MAAAAVHRMCAWFCMLCLGFAANIVYAQTHTWKFLVLLDDKPIGHHHFTLTTDGERKILKSEASFDVKFLFLTAYRYRHAAAETWRNGCLESLKSNTDDDGKMQQATARLENGRLIVTTRQGREDISGCAMSFAYWNPHILQQARLLNPQSGKVEAVRIARLDDEPLTVGGHALPARRYRIDTSSNPIELWYAEDGKWLRLASTVNGGHRLVYQLQE